MENKIFNEYELTVLLDQYHLLETRVNKLWKIYADSMVIEWSPMLFFDVADKEIVVVLNDGREYYIPREWLTVSNGVASRRAITLYEEALKHNEQLAREDEIKRLKARLATLEAK